MLSRTLTLAAAVVAISSFAFAQTSSNPSMQPNPGGDPKAETAGTTGKIEAENKGAKVKGAKKNPKAGESSSTPAMAPAK